MREKIVSADRLKEIVGRSKAEGKKIVAAGGCFDLLHAGHVTYLEEAASKGDLFLVFLNSDASVRGLKGKTRPIVPQQERALVLAALRCVDYVCIFEEDTPCSVIEKVQPDSFVKGGDYRGKHISESDSVKKYGGKVEYVDLVDGCSTTNMIERIVSGMGGRKDERNRNRRRGFYWKLYRKDTERYGNRKHCYR